MPFYRRKRTYASKRRPRYYKRKYAPRKRKVAGTSKVRGAWEIHATAKTTGLRQKVMRLPTVGGQLAQRMVVRMGLDHCRISHAPAAIRGSEAIKINSIYDPLILCSGTIGVQPTLHDALASLYQHYRVYGCHVKAFIRNTCTSPIVAGLLFADILPTGTMTSSIIRRSCTTSAIINRTSDSNDACVLEQYVPFKTLNAVKVNDSVNQALFGAAPSDLFYGMIYTASTDGTTNVTAEIIVDLTFDVMVSAPDVDRSVD